MPRQPVKKVRFEIPANQALKIRDFLVDALHVMTPLEGSVGRKNAARRLLDQLNVGLRITVGPIPKGRSKKTRADTLGDMDELVKIDLSP